MEETLTVTRLGITGKLKLEFGIFARGADGWVLAGICAIVWGGYCELEAMWVEESLRNRGLAHALISGAEAEARRRGCTLVVHAYDLLARRG
jgi:GNAT superfamily N-acetyltransferase